MWRDGLDMCETSRTDLGSRETSRVSFIWFNSKSPLRRREISSRASSRKYPFSAPSRAVFTRAQGGHSNDCWPGDLNQLLPRGWQVGGSPSCFSLISGDSRRPSGLAWTPTRHVSGGHAVALRRSYALASRFRHFWHHPKNGCEDVSE